MNLILASGSPRRKELLSLYTTDFTICVSDFDESGVTAPTPAQLVEKLARGKCLAVAKDHPARWCWDVTPSWMWRRSLRQAPQRGGRKADAPRPVRRDPRGAYRRLRVGRRTHRELRGQLQGDLLPDSEGRSTPTRPRRSPTTRPVPTPSRAAQPSGSTGWKGTTTPSWACPSAGRPVC